TPWAGRPKPAVWLGGAIKSPPFSADARQYAGGLIRRVQVGERLSMPLSRAMPSIGERCHEFRAADGDVDWRIIYRIDPDAILIVEVFRKKTRSTPRHVIETCQWRLKRYDQKRKAR
ncbi:MAG TPA: type II toxin-antitoxin system RelE/ParE family toxin, partial [Longimicrobium sp.]|nr:type II toxin-antitoxin system RelE/ParE family toxin [Longimicrobium sp.]